MPKGVTNQSFRVDLLSKSEYYPGGMPILDLSYQLESKRYGYNSGAEVDREIFSQKDRAFSTLFREGDTYTLRWWSQDPKRNELPHQSTYSYMDANPILKNDPLGDLPGDLFTNVTTAVHDFGKNYNPLSIKYNREYYSNIKVVYKDGKKYYTYDIPEKIGATGGMASIPSSSKAIIHTHGGFNDTDGDGLDNYDRNNFSPDDEEAAKSTNKDIYVVTPAGYIKVYYVKTGKPKVLAKDMPKDLRHPDAKNNTTKEVENKDKRDIPYTETNKDSGVLENKTEKR